ncbi:MAG TPA: alpha-hydroxy acid oxidase [Kofleriaceae bacterium]|nr:alpha-hydroxy acid oxidase [Kofleriaceae bacterium]
MIHLGDFEAVARERLERSVYDYFAGGAEDEWTLARNRAAWAEIALHHRVMVGVAERDPSTRVLGHRLAIPALVAPMAFQRLAHPDGELATLRATAAAGSLTVLSMGASVPLEQAAAAAGGALWFQIYMLRDRGRVREVVTRAAAAGCRAIVLTVDSPVFGRRERDARNAFQTPPGLSVPAVGDASFAEVAAMIDPGVTWDDLDWLRGISDVPIVVKGVVRADDAIRAVERGAAGIIVSNHGGRQLDGAPATADVLPAVVAAVAGRTEVLVDGGIRRGADVVRALALGARAVLVGRPILWALAADGEAGVGRALGLLAAEIDRAMALCGCPDVASITRALVAP